MNRLTFKEPNGNWGVVGMNKDNEKEKVYSCLAKLLDYEETELDPDDVQHLIYKSAGDKYIVKVGMIIEGYEIIIMSPAHCLAKRKKPINCNDFVIWKIDDSRCGVNTGRYFDNLYEALSKFYELNVIYLRQHRIIPQ